jgi:hypothetical protein
LKAVVIEAKSDQVCQHTSSPTIDVAKAVFESHEPDYTLAIESQAEIEPMWLVRVIRKRGCVGPAKKFADWGVEHCIEKGERAVEVTRLFPSSSLSTNACCDDVQKRRFFVLTKSLRHNDLTPHMEAKQNPSGGGNRSRAAAEPNGPGEGEQPDAHYELRTEKRREVALLCREYA